MPTRNQAQHWPSVLKAREVFVSLSFLLEFGYLGSQIIQVSRKINAGEYNSARSCVEGGSRQ